jgi:hypothetical protein
MLRLVLSSILAAAFALPLSAASARAQDDPNYWSGKWDTLFNVINWRLVSDSEGKQALADLQPPDGTGTPAACGPTPLYYLGTYRNDAAVGGLRGVHAACTNGNQIVGRFKDAGGSGWYRATADSRNACQWEGIFRADGASQNESWLGEYVGRVSDDGGPNVCARGWRFSVSTYANDVRVAPPLVAWHQLCLSKLEGDGELSADGSSITGTFTQSVKCPSRPGGPRNKDVSIKHRIINGRLTVTRTSEGLVRRLVGEIRVTSAERPDLCPVRAVGVLTLRDDPRRLDNGETSDFASTRWPEGVRCPEQGWDNRDAPAAQPPRGGPPDGGHWAIVRIR